MPPVIGPVIPIRSFQIADEIDLKRCRAEFPGDLLATSPGELFYRGRPQTLSGQPPAEEQSYLYVMDYGVVTFAGYSEPEMAAVIDRLQVFCQDPLAARTGEEFRVHPNSQELLFNYNDSHLPKVGAEAMRIIMLYVGQSAALDYYETLINGMMDETGRFARELERNGRLKTSRRNVQRFIGRILLMRNRIVDNLYIMDAPDITWENEYLDKLDRGMKKTFDVAERFRSLDFQLREIKENLELYVELLQFRHSTLLEWIIIILILIEVVNVFAH